jgi:hypothetical protein
MGWQILRFGEAAEVLEVNRILTFDILLDDSGMER